MKYDELKELLDRLFDQLYIPIGGADDNTQSIWMKESSKRLVTIATDNGFITVANTGQVIKSQDIAEVEAIYLIVFKDPSCIYDIVEGILEENAS